MNPRRRRHNRLARKQRRDNGGGLWFIKDGQRIEPFIWLPRHVAPSQIFGRLMLRGRG